MDTLFETEHLIVRTFRDADARPLYENHLDDEVRKWFPNECYPDAEEERRLAGNFLSGKVADQIESICKTEDVLKMKETVAAVHLSEGVIQYIQEIVDITREEKRFVLGASPRAMLALIRASQAHAYLEELDFVKPDDVKAVAINVLHHRLSLTSEAMIQGEDVDKVLKALVVKVTVPMK